MPTLAVRQITTRSQLPYVIWIDNFAVPEIDFVALLMEDVLILNVLKRLIDNAVQ